MVSPKLVGISFWPVIVGIIAISVFSTVFSATGSFFGELMQCGDGGCRTPMPIVFVPTPDPRLFMSAELGTKLTYDDKQLLVYQRYTSH